MNKIVQIMPIDVKTKKLLRVDDFILGVGLKESGELVLIDLCPKTGKLVEFESQVFLDRLYHEYSYKTISGGNAIAAEKYLNNYLEYCSEKDNIDIIEITPVAGNNEFTFVVKYEEF